MNGGDPPRLRLPDSGLESVATDHVRLSYHYLDVGDLDGYGSLFEEWAVHVLPGLEPVCGRAALERFEQARWKGRRARYLIFEVIGAGRRVVAVGRIVLPPAPGAPTTAAVDFVDLFRVADYGLLAERRSYFQQPDQF